MKFDKLYRQLNIGVSPSGKATDSDSVIRWFESSYPSHWRYILCNIVCIYTRYSVLFIAYKLLCRKLWGSCGVNCGVKQAENKPRECGLFLFYLSQILRLSKFVVYFLSLVVEVFFGVVGIAPIHGGGLDVSVKGMPRPEHDRL